jgi:prevent-host-death family protein
MSSEYVGIETARKNLGDLVDQVQDGDTVILTRNGRAVARLAAYQPEDTVTVLNLTQTAARVIARARANSNFDTAAEFDYDIKRWFDRSMDGIGGVSGPLGNACYEIANEGFAGTAVEQDDRYNQLWSQLQPELTAYAHRCRERKYSGWSAAAKSRGQRVQYAD